MKQTTLRVLPLFSFLLTASAAALFAESGSDPDAVICRTNQTLLQRGADLKPVNEPMNLSPSIKVSTNCTYQVEEGKDRDLEPGQTLRADGFLLNADGSIVPVADHVAMNKGVVTVYKDGKGQAITSSLTLGDGSTVDPDGSYSRPNGRRGRLRDGQILTMGGAALPSLDTITFRGGKVTVYKSGALVTIDAANQTMGMADGTKVRGDGFLISRDGAETPLKEGQTITVESLRAEW